MGETPLEASPKPSRRFYEDHDLRAVCGLHQVGASALMISSAMRIPLASVYRLLHRGVINGILDEVTDSRRVGITRRKKENYPHA